MTDTATRVASLDTEALGALHKSLDVLDPADPAVIEAHHLVTVEMARRGVPHGHDGDPWASAAVVVDEAQVDSPDQIEAPAGMEKAWGDALANGGTVSVLLTVDGYVLKADPGVGAVHTDTIMGSGEDEDEDEFPVVKAWDDPAHLTTLTDDDRAWFAKVSEILDAGGDPDLLVEKKGNPEPLRDYWRAGGKGQIQWGAGGDFTACAAAVARYMSVEEAKGYCAIRHRETTGMWPGDKRNRVTKAEREEYATSVTLPDGTKITTSPVTKHGSHDQSTHGHGGGTSTSTSAPSAGGGGAGEVAMPKDMKRRVRSELGRGAQVEAYSAGLESGRIARGAGKEQADRMVAARVARRDEQAARLAKAPARSHVSEGLAFAIVGDQGFIDGATGTRSGFPRTHSVGETIAGFVFGGLSGATKAVEPVAKHGDHDQSTHGRKGKGGGLKVPDNPPGDPSKHGADSIAAARKERARIAAAEPAITDSMVALAEKHGGTLEGLDFRLKSEKSLARKIDSEKDDPKFDGDAEKCAASMSDVARYTMTFGDTQYVEGTRATLKSMEAEGYELRVKNYWKKGDPYQGINVAVTDPRTGITFEVQFHTPTSLDFKEPRLDAADPMNRQSTHRIYETYRESRDTRVRYRTYSSMRRQASAIPTPPPPAALLSIGDLRFQSFTTGSGQQVEV